MKHITHLQYNRVIEHVTYQTRDTTRGMQKNNHAPVTKHVVKHVMHPQHSHVEKHVTHTQHNRARPSQNSGKPENELHHWYI